MTQLWKIVCLAYQGDTKNCTTPCLHCARIEDALAVNLAVAEESTPKEIERLTLENWQLKSALGYSVPSHIDHGNFKCGLCEARRNRPKKFSPPHLRGQGATRELALAAAICSAMGYAWPCTYDRYSGKWAKEAVSKYWIEIAEHALEANKEYDLEDMGPAPIRSAWPYD